MRFSPVTSTFLIFDSILRSHFGPVFARIQHVFLRKNEPFFQILPATSTFFTFFTFFKTNLPKSPPLQVSKTSDDQKLSLSWYPVLPVLNRETVDDGSSQSPLLDTSWPGSCGSLGIPSGSPMISGFRGVFNRQKVNWTCSKTATHELTLASPHSTHCDPHQFSKTPSLTTSWSSLDL